MVDPKERRRSALSDEDMDRIGDAFDKRLNNLFEVIGYDTSTPNAREEIRKDHGFVREARRAKGRVIGAFFGSIGAAIAAFAWSAFTAGKH